MPDEEVFPCTFSATADWQAGGYGYRNVTNHPGCCKRRTDARPLDPSATGWDREYGFDNAWGLDVVPCNITYFSDMFYQLKFTKTSAATQGLLTDDDCKILFNWDTFKDAPPINFTTSRDSGDRGSIKPFLPNFKCDAAVSAASTNAVALSSSISTSSSVSIATTTASRAQNSSMTGAAAATATVSAAVLLFAHPLMCVLPMVLSVLVTAAV